MVGQGGTYTLTVRNAGTGDTDAAVTVVDDLPSQLVPDWTGTHSSGDWSCTYSGQRVTCTTSAVIAEGGSSQFTVPVKAVSNGSATNTAAVGGGGDPVNGGTPDPGTCTAGAAHCGSATVQINTAAAITTQKVLSQINGQPAAAGASVEAGDVLTYTITSTNSGETAGSTLLTDRVPAGTTYTGIGGIDDPAWTCENDEVVAGTECTQTQAVPANGGQTSSTFTVTVDTPAPAGGIANAVTSSADDDCTACSTSNPVLLPSISLAKTVGSSPMVVGQANSYTLTVSNSGQAVNSQAIVVRDTLPGTLSIGALPTDCALDPADSQTVVCTIAAEALAVGASQSFTIPVTPTAAGSVTNNATATGGGGEPDDCNGSGDCAASVTTPVNTPAAISTQKVLSHVNGQPVSPGAGVAAGDVLTYTITSSNSGRTAGSTLLTDHVPAGTTYTGVGGIDDPAWACENDDQFPDLGAIDRASAENQSGWHGARIGRHRRQLGFPGGRADAGEQWFLGQGDLVGYALVSVPTCVTTQKVTENSTGTFTFANTNLVTPSGAAAASGTITTTAPNTATNGDLTMVRKSAATSSLPKPCPPRRPAGVWLARAVSIRKAATRGATAAVLET